MENKQRSILSVIVLSIITCGIYFFVWMYQTTRNLNEYTNDYRLSPGTVILLTIITCGIYGIYWWYRINDLFIKAQQKVGYKVYNDNKVLFIVLSLFGLNIVNMAILQSDLNLLWRTDTTEPETKDDDWTDY
ncbi:DUF4234 domain-containing protein [Enterococcus sp. JM9B]|uniref:DUF4234 domain-containing protein n=1 Tax=Enterococcus sp. JM9B TaxID=1857216 RepID=UPI001374B42F|nr:DUF4234 domain-containing protein [Enterococcus sp. JM9B]KAF1300173.1 hypothetical protein BAU16_13075 [Enterococcus sp. JM9B]